MLSHVLKAAVSLIVIYVIFFIWSYFNGPLYEGKKYQYKALQAEAKAILLQYNSYQEEYFKANNTYDNKYHEMDIFKKSKKFQLGFNDIDIVNKYCSECRVLGRKYKIAVYGRFGKEDFIWTIDELGNIDNLKEK